mmetsp:Transcript_44865/g.138763  ORF Transcript_44865/g.138763 Transcript_44865/m.138763 type:complete len:352 (+) Transcript_44865:119-1174(+)
MSGRSVTLLWAVQGARARSTSLRAAARAVAPAGAGGLVPPGRRWRPGSCAPGRKALCTLAAAGLLCPRLRQRPRPGRPGARAHPRPWPRPGPQALPCPDSSLLSRRGAARDLAWSLRSNVGAAPPLDGVPRGEDGTAECGSGSPTDALASDLPTPASFTSNAPAVERIVPNLSLKLVCLPNASSPSQAEAKSVPAAYWSLHLTSDSWPCPRDEDAKGHPCNGSWQDWAWLAIHCAGSLPWQHRPGLPRAAKGGTSERAASPCKVQGLSCVCCGSRLRRGPPMSSSQGCCRARLTDMRWRGSLCMSIRMKSFAWWDKLLRQPFCLKSFWKERSWKRAQSASLPAGSAEWNIG